MADKPDPDEGKPKLKGKEYAKALRKLQAELCHLQAWVKHKGLRVIVIFEGRDGAGKGGTILAITERVMGFCTDEQYERFLELCPDIERYITEGGIILVKYWLEVSNKEQERRFEARIEDPLRQWKLSVMDLPSREKWYEYSLARDAMLKATDTKHSPWHILRSDDKKRARLNCIAHLLESIPYKKLKRGKIDLPKRSKKHEYDDQAALKGRRAVPEKY